MCFSHMHNAETLTNGLSAIICHHSVLSASSQESYTQQLEEFIFTCLLTSAGSSVLDAWIFSMWRVGTQTLSLLREHQRRAMITQSKMARLLREGSSGRAEVDLEQLVDSRRSLTCARLRVSFSTYTERWILEASSRISRMSDPTRSGGMLEPYPSMSHPPALESSVEEVMDEINGWHNLVYDLETWS